MTVCACRDCECFFVADEDDLCLACKHGQHIQEEE